MKNFFLIILLFVAIHGYSYELKGKISIANNWQPKVYLASINSPTDLFVSSPEFVINESTIDADGQFLLSGDDLPEDDRYYRLYIVQNQFSTVEFYNLPVRNFMHLLLNNNSSIQITAINSNAIFQDVSITPSENNIEIHQFENEYYKKKSLLDGLNTKAKRDFLNQSLTKYIHEFVSNCKNPLIGLFALYHVEDKETDFLRNSKLYFNFQDFLIAEYPNSTYTNSYDELLSDLVGFRDLVCEMPQVSQPWKDWIIYFESGLILLLILLIFKLKQKRAINNSKKIKELLTDKELSILQNMAEGKANKEIAAELFIELSTVKTHINSIYKKLGVSNRSEAAKLFNKQ